MTPGADQLLVAFHVEAGPLNLLSGERRDHNDHSKQSAQTSMDISAERVREIFKGLETGDGAAFFEHVADDVDWTMMGTHPLAGHYSRVH